MSNHNIVSEVLLTVIAILGPILFTVAWIVDLSTGAPAETELFHRGVATATLLLWAFMYRTHLREKRADRATESANA